jgi:transposase-like protein
MMAALERWEPTATLIMTMFTAALVFGDFETPVRTVFALVFLTLVPGLALMRLAHLPGLGMRIFLAVPVSLCLAALVSGVLVYAGVPSWDLGVSILISVTVAAVIVDIAEPIIPEFLAEETGPRRLDSEERQALLMRSLLGGASIQEAAHAAQVSPATVHREIRRSERLRRAIDLARRSVLEVEVKSLPEPDETVRERSRPRSPSNPT